MDPQETKTEREQRSFWAPIAAFGYPLALLLSLMLILIGVLLFPEAEGLGIAIAICIGLVVVFFGFFAWRRSTAIDRPPSSRQ